MTKSQMIVAICERERLLWNCYCDAKDEEVKAAYRHEWSALNDLINALGI